jgi:hypothetical protein
MSAAAGPPYAALIGNVPSKVKESEIALKIQDTCGKTSFEYLLEYTPKQPCYQDIAKTNDPLTNWWLVVEFENPNALKACVAMDGMVYKGSLLKVRELGHKEYDDTCGMLGIMKARTKQIKKNLKGKRLSIVLASNVSSRVTSDALYKFFSFPGDPIEVTMDRARKLALIAYDTEEQAVIALACDQAILGPAMVRIELYRPEKHGKDLQLLLKVGQTGDLTHVGAQTGYVQISERGSLYAPESPAVSRAAGTPLPYDPRLVAPPPQNSAAPVGHAPRSLYPNTDPTALVTNFGAEPAKPPTLPPKPSAPQSPNPYAHPTSPRNPYAHLPASGHSPYPPSASAQLKQPAPVAGVAQPASRDWSSIVPTAKYTVTTEYK